MYKTKSKEIEELEMSMIQVIDILKSIQIFLYVSLLLFVILSNSVFCNRAAALLFMAKG